MQVHLPLRHHVSDPCMSASALISLFFAALQAIGATTPAWTAILAWCILGIRETMMTYSALLPLMIGVVINTGFEPSFNLIGFTACAIATCARALKSVMQVSNRLGGARCLPIASFVTLPGMHSLHWPELHACNMDHLLGQGIPVEPREQGNGLVACQHHAEGVFWLHTESSLQPAGTRLAGQVLPGFTMLQGTMLTLPLQLSSDAHMPFGALHFGYALPAHLYLLLPASDLTQAELAVVAGHMLGTCLCVADPHLLSAEMDAASGCHLRV